MLGYFSFLALGERIVLILYLWIIKNTYMFIFSRQGFSVHSLGYSRTLSRPGWPKLTEILDFYLLSAGIKAEDHYYSGTEKHLFLSF